MVDGISSKPTGKIGCGCTNLNSSNLNQTWKELEAYGGVPSLQPLKQFLEKRYHCPQI
jgi:hypothetical protein